MKDHGGMALADYLIDKLQAGRKFKAARTRWDGGNTVTAVVEDADGRWWTLTIEPHITETADG